MNQNFCVWVQNFSLDKALGSEFVVDIAPTFPRNNFLVTVLHHVFCQVGVGLPALPALVQAKRVIRDNKEPLFGGVMAPPRQPVNPESEDELAYWHKELDADFELGTLYTMIAGLLNILVVCDAYAGPFLAAADKKEKDKKKSDRSDKPPPE